MMALNATSVLPPNATAQEKQLADVAWRLNDPPDITTVTQPEAIASKLLPWLAWAMSADVWNSAETEGVKRGSVLRAAELHRRKGTVEGFRRLCSLFGATLAAVARPPHKTFCGKSYTQAEKDAMLAVYPQLRIRTQAKRGTRIASGIYCKQDYLGAAGGVWSSADKSWDDASDTWDSAASNSLTRVTARRFLIRSDAGARMAPQVYYYDQGIETELAAYQESLDSDGYIRVCVAAVRRYATFCGRFARYTSDCGAAARIYSLSITYEYGSAVRWKTLLAGLDPISVYPEMTYEGSTRQGVFCGPRHGGSFLGQYLVRSDAENRIYKRIYLFDATRALESHGKSTYLGAMRLGMPAYTAELQVVWPGTRARRAAGRFVCGYTVRADRDLYNRFVTALAWARSARDKVLLDTYSYKPLTAGEIHAAGASLVCGQLVKRF